MRAHQPLLRCVWELISRYYGVSLPGHVPGLLMGRLGLLRSSSLTAQRPRRSLRWLTAEEQSEGPGEDLPQLPRAHRFPSSSACQRRGDRAPSWPDGVSPPLLAVSLHSDGSLSHHDGLNSLIPAQPGSTGASESHSPIWFWSSFPSSSFNLNWLHAWINKSVKSCFFKH